MGEGNGYAGLDAVLGNVARRFVEVVAPGFEHIGKLRFRSITERERSQYESHMLTTKGMVKLEKLEQQRQRLIAMCWVDGEGNPNLSISESHKLQDLDAKLTAYMFDVCSEHCGLTREDFDELEKNSERINVA